MRITKVFAEGWRPINGAILALRRLKCFSVSAARQGPGKSSRAGDGRCEKRDFEAVVHAAIVRIRQCENGYWRNYPITGSVVFVGKGPKVY